MQRFLANVPLDPNGYRWVNLGGYGPEDGDELYAESLVLQSASHEETQKKLRDGNPVSLEPTYDPFVVEPALFRIFASVEPTPASILAFANKYGDIASFDVILEEGGLPLSIWRREIGYARKGVEHADKIAAALESGKGKANAIKDAMKFLGATVETVAVYLMPVTQNGGIGLREVIGNLLDVINLQLAVSLVENKRYRSCEQCGKPFEVTPQVNRADRVFCSDNCRVKAYQRRKKQAIALRQQGESLRAIVKATGSDMESVKRWVEGVGRKEA